MMHFDEESMKAALKAKLIKAGAGQEFIDAAMEVHEDLKWQKGYSSDMIAEVTRLRAEVERLRASQDRSYCYFCADHDIGHKKVNAERATLDRIGKDYERLFTDKEKQLDAANLQIREMKEFLLAFPHMPSMFSSSGGTLSSECSPEHCPRCRVETFLGRDSNDKGQTNA